MTCFSALAPPSGTCTLSLHDALPISKRVLDADLEDRHGATRPHVHPFRAGDGTGGRDRKSTRLNSSHRTISYAVFCLKKKSEDPDSPGPVHLRAEHRRTQLDR